MHAFEKLTQPRRRRASHHQRPAADRADRRAPPDAASSGTSSRASAHPHPLLPADAGDRPPPPARAVPVRRPGAQGRRRRAASAPAPGSRSSSASTTRDPLFLQIKEAQPSVLERFVGKSEYGNYGQRVVAGQRLMQATSDIFLGWQRVAPALDGEERDFYVRQLKDWKGSLRLRAAVPPAQPRTGGSAAWTLARAHARSGDRVAIAAYLGRSDVLRPGDRSVRRDATPTRTSATTRALKEPRTRDGRIEVQTGLRAPTGRDHGEAALTGRCSVASARTSARGCRGTSSPASRSPPWRSRR